MAPRIAGLASALRGALVCCAVGALAADVGYPQPARAGEAAAAPNPAGRRLRPQGRTAPSETADSSQLPRAFHAWSTALPEKESEAATSHARADDAPAHAARRLQSVPPDTSGDYFLYNTDAGQDGLAVSLSQESGVLAYTMRTMAAATSK